MPTPEEDQRDRMVANQSADYQKAKQATQHVQINNEYAKSVEKERDRRLDKAKETLKSQDPKGYKGDPVREYRKELARRVAAMGRDKAIGTPERRHRTDREIATRMHMAGYGHNEIQKAIVTASPHTVGMTKDQKQGYFQDKIVSEQSKGLNSYMVRDAARDFQDRRKGFFPDNERRLDRLGLETKNTQKHTQSHAKNRDKSVEHGHNH